DAEPAEQLLGRVLLGDEGLGREIIQEAGQLGVGAPHLAIGRAHFIEEFRGRKGDSRLLDSYPLSTMRQAARSGLQNDPVTQPWRVSRVLFSGILIRCRSLEQRCSASRRR